MFLLIEIHANKLIPHSELMIFIGYENNGYCFIYHIQGNIIFCSTHAIFNKRLFPKCTNSHRKEYKLYDELLDKTSLETESLVSNSSEKDGPALVPILHTFIPSIQKSPPTHSLLPSLSYKFIFFPPTPELKKPTVEIKEINDSDSDVEIQLSNLQQPLQPGLQTPQEGSELRRSKHQTQILFRKGYIYGKQEYPTNILWNPLWQPRNRFPNPNMACDRHENAHQKS